MKVSIMITGKNSGRKRRSGLKGRIMAALCLGWLEFGDAGKEEDSHKERRGRNRCFHSLAHKLKMHLE